MKRLTAILLIMMLAFGCAFAEVSEMSLDELFTLRDQINQEILSREQKEFKVPSGVWVIGEEVPAGTYSIASPLHFGTVTVYKSQEKGLSNFVGEFAVYEDDPLGKITLENGWVVILSQSMVFAPPKGIEF